MKKKDKSSSIMFTVIRNLMLGTIFVLIVFFAGLSLWNHLKASNLFVIRTIVVSDPSMEFIRSSRLVNLKGQNIFTVKLSAWAEKLQRQYPEISEIKLQKRFPDQIVVMTKKRIPFAKMNVRNKEVILDLRGIVLSISSNPTSLDLPMIVGGTREKISLQPGALLKGQDIQSALLVIRTFRMNKYLSVYKILKIDVSNLSQIEFFITDSVKVILDQNNLYSKIQMLSLMLSQAKLKLEEVNYIDLRFNEPTIGKRTVTPK